MPLTPEEPQIYESVPGPRSAAGKPRSPQASRPAPVPGPRGSSRPAPGRADGKGPASGRPAKGRVQQSAPGGKKTSTAEIEIRPAGESGAVETADGAVDAILDDGRAPGDVLLVTTGEEHPWAQHEKSFGEDAYWSQFDDGSDVFCAHAADLTRLTGRPVVVLAVNGGTDAQVAEALPAAMARAGERLVVCGDPNRLSALL